MVGKNLTGKKKTLVIIAVLISFCAVFLTAFVLPKAQAEDGSSSDSADVSADTRAIGSIVSENLDAALRKASVAEKSTGDVRLLECVNQKKGVFLRWSAGAADSDDDGFQIYRRTSSSSAWKKIRRLDGASYACWVDKTASAGESCEYAVRTFRYTDGEEAANEKSSGSTLDFSSVRSLTRISVPENVRVGKTEDGQLKVTWDAVTGAEEYDVEYSKNSAFYGDLKKETVSETSCTFSISGKPYYIRVRAKSGSDTSSWSYGGYAGKTVRSTVSYVYTRSGGSVHLLNLRSDFRQKMGGYDTVQGTCSDGGTNFYTVLWNKTKRGGDYARIARWNLKTRKLTKISKPLRIRHGNSITYNSRKKQLVVCLIDETPKRLAVIDAKTLKLVRYVDVEMPEKLYGASASKLKKYAGLSCISYNRKRNCYIAKFRGGSTAVILDSGFRPVRAFSAPIASSSTLSQNLLASDDAVICVASGGNSVKTYDWEGRKIAEIPISGGYELEAAAYTGGSLYGVCYRSYYQTFKVRRRVTKRVKTKSGKKKKKKVWKTYYERRFMRAGHVYRINRF